MNKNNLRNLIKEELKHALNKDIFEVDDKEDSSEFNIEKMYQDRISEPSFIRDLEPNITYQITYSARNMYGDKEIETTQLTLTPKEKENNIDSSIKNYLNNTFNIPQYTITGIKSVKKA
jgi:hypothetical protein